MALKPAICTQCGASIDVDDSKEAGICKHCGTAFITEKVIANYVNNYSTVNNITNNVTKIINGGKDSDDAEDFFNRGLTNLKLKKDWAAEDNFTKAIDLAPEVAKYYFYRYISKSYNISPFIGTDAESFFTLATEKEKQDLGKEFGLDLTDLNTAAYSSCKRTCIENNFKPSQLEYLVGSKHIDLESESYINLCNDFCEKQIEIYNQNNSYKELDVLIALKKSFIKGENVQINSKLDELINKIDDIATKAYCKRIDNTLYLLSPNYIPNEYKNNDTFKVSDPSINNVIFGAFRIDVNNFILTKNIKNINRLYSNLFKDGYKLEEISYAQESPIWAKYLTIEEDCDEQTTFKVTENIVANCIIVPATFKKAEFNFKCSGYWGVSRVYLKILGKDTKVNSFLYQLKYVHESDKNHIGYVKNGKLYLPTTYNNTICYYDKVDNEFCKFIKEYEPEVLENYIKHGQFKKQDYRQNLDTQEKIKRLLIICGIGLGIVAFIAFIIISVSTGGL